MYQVEQIQQLQTPHGRNGQATIEVQKPNLDEVTSRNLHREELPLNDNSEMWLRRLASLSQGHFGGARQ